MPGNQGFMQAAFIRTLGPPEVIEFGDFPLPDVGPDDALVCVNAVALNLADLYIRAGHFDTVIPLPYVMGRDVVGTVARLGAQVRNLKVGQRVWSNALGLRGRQGTFAEFVTAPAELLFPLPHEVDDVHAVAALHSGLTAVVGLEKAQLQAGETIMINGSGNVGQAVISLAKSSGARVIATAGNARKAELCRQLGADVVVLYREADLTAELRQAAPGGVHVWWEVTPQPNLARALGALASNDCMILISGFTTNGSFALGDFYTRNLTLYGFAVSNLFDSEVRRAAPRISAALGAGTLRPQIADVLPLSEARSAHTRLQAEGVQGKLVLTP